MELSEELQRGLQRLAQFSPKAFSSVLRGALHSLTGGPEPHSMLDDRELQRIGPCALKESHTAITACLLEAARHRADRDTLSTLLEDCKFDAERTEEFWAEYQKHHESLEILLENIGRCPPHVSDVSWRLAYEIKTNQLYQTHRPSYLVNFSLESCDPSQAQDVTFNCSMEQLQDLVGKLKDAAKSLERTSQV
ncbi:COMM domain-containing protein 3 [Gastrophryne carolinensis]